MRTVLTFAAISWKVLDRFRFGSRFAISPHGVGIAMGYLAAAHAAAGSALQLVVRDVPRPARVAPLPFVPTRYYRG